MNQLEDRLKDAYAAAAGTVSPENIRQLNEPSVLLTWPQAKRSRSARRWAMPLGAVAAVAVIAIAAAALPAFLTSSGNSNGRAARGLGERFVSALTPGSRQFVIVSAATGAKVASVSPPAPGEVFSTAATGDGVTYVAAVTRPGVCGTRLYKFSLDRAGKPGQLTPFDGGRLLADVTLLALSADGRSFADLVHVCPTAKDANSSLYFVNFRTGQRRRWIVPNVDAVNGLSLSGDGGTLVVGGAPIGGLRAGILLVNTASRSGPIVLHSLVLVTADELGHHHGFTVALPVITPDGHTVFLVSTGPGQVNPGEQIRSVAAIIEWPRSAVKLVASVPTMTSLAADPSVRREIGIRQVGQSEFRAFMINLKTGRITYLKPSFYRPASGRYIW